MENLAKPECSVQTYSGSVTHCIIKIIVYISINKFTVSEGFIWIKGMSSTILYVRLSCHNHLSAH